MRAFVRPTESAFDKFFKFFRSEVKNGFYTTDPAGQEMVAVREFDYLPTWVRALCTVVNESPADVDFKNGMELSEQQVLSLAGRVFFKPGAVKHPELKLFFYMTCKGTWISNESGNIFVGGHRAAFVALLERIGLEPRLFNASFEDYAYPEGGTKAAMLNIKPWQVVKPEYQDRVNRLMETEALAGITLDKESEYRLGLAKGEARAKAVQALVLIKKLDKKDDVLKTLLNYRKQDKWRQDRQDKFLAPLIGSNWKETVGPVFGVGYFPVEAPAPKKATPPKAQKAVRTKGLDSLKDVYQKKGESDDPKQGEAYASLAAEIKSQSKEAEPKEKDVRWESMGYHALTNAVVVALAACKASNCSPSTIPQKVLGFASTSLESIHVFLLSAPEFQVNRQISNDELLQSLTLAAKMWLNSVEDLKIGDPSVINLIKGETLRQRFTMVETFESALRRNLNNTLDHLRMESAARYTEEEAACKHLWIEVERRRLSYLNYLSGGEIDTVRPLEIIQEMTELVKSRTRVKVDAVPGSVIKAFQGSTDVVKTMDDLRALRDFTKGMTHLTGPIGDIIKQLQSSNDMVINEAMYIATTKAA